MREIKFRGIDKHGVWHYGFYWEDPSGNYYIKEKINSSHYADYEIVKESLGEFTGLKDKNRKEIYEGDILRAIYSKNRAWYDKTVSVEINDGSYGYEINYKEIKTIKRKADKKLLEDWDKFSEYTIIGNVYENPECLEEKNEVNK